MNYDSGRQVRLVEVLAGAMWLVTFGLITLDVFASPCVLGHLGAYGLATSAGAATVTFWCIAQRHLDATCRQMRSAFELGKNASVKAIR